MIKNYVAIDRKSGKITEKYECEDVMITRFDEDDCPVEGIDISSRDDIFSMMGNFNELEDRYSSLEDEDANVWSFLEEHGKDIVVWDANDGSYEEFPINSYNNLTEWLEAIDDYLLNC